MPDSIQFFFWEKLEVIYPLDFNIQTNTIYKYIHTGRNQ